MDPGGGGPGPPLPQLKLVKKKKKKKKKKERKKKDGRRAGTIFTSHRPSRCTRHFIIDARLYRGYIFAYRMTRQIIPGVYFHIPYDTPNYTPLVCCNFKFDMYKFTKVILPAKYIIYAFKSYS